MGCKLTKSIDGKACDYSVAGAKALYLANFYNPVVGAAAVEDKIAYTTDADKAVSAIKLPTGETFFRIDGRNNTISFTDALLLGGNGGKYRQHTVNAQLNAEDADVLNEGDALALGRFVAIVVDNAGKATLLGRTAGLIAPAGGLDYASGSAEADSNGWTLILQGPSTEIAPHLTAESVITPIYTEVVTP